MYDYGGNEYWGSSEQTGVTPAVKWLVVANVVTYFLMLIVHAVLGKAQGLAYHDMIEVVGFVPTSAIEKLHLWQLVTYAFVHAMSPLHILFNMYMLWWAGCDVERQVGTRHFLWFYLSAAVIAALVHVPTAYLLTETPATAVVGASGAVLAVLVVYAGFFPDRRIYILVFGPFATRTVVMVIVAIDLALLLSLQNDNVASAVHLGGVAFGFGYLNLRTRIERFFDRMRRQIEERERLEQRNLKLDVDNVLRKIHENGLESLTREERAILNKASKHYRDNK